MNRGVASLFKRVAKPAVATLFGSMLVLSVAIGSLPSTAMASGGNGNEIEFNDMSQASWATEDVAQLAADGIVNGVGNNDFAPNQPITNAEALALIDRALSGGQTPSGVTLQFQDSNQIPSWAVSAIEEDISLGVLQNSGVLNPNAPTTRAQFVTWLLSGMGLTTQASSTPTTDLSAFTDASQIPAQDAGFVALAVQMGLLNGVSTTQIDPNGTITRAESAAMVARAQRTFGTPAETSAQSTSLVTGVVSSVSGSTINVTEADGSIVAVPTTATTVFMSKENTATLSSVAVGSNVTVALDANGNAILVVVRQNEGDQSQQEAQNVEGTVSTISSTSITITPTGDNGGDNNQSSGTVQTVTATTYTLDPSVAVVFRGQSMPLASVVAGSQVNLGIDAQGNVGTIIVQKMQETISGATITAINDGSRLTVTEANGTVVTVKVGDSTVITDPSGATVGSSVLAVGDVINLTGMFGEEGITAGTISIVTESTTPTTTSGSNQGD